MQLSKEHNIIRRVGRAQPTWLLAFVFIIYSFFKREKSKFNNQSSPEKVSDPLISLGVLYCKKNTCNLGLHPV